jgi:hypothetical protein
VQRARIQSQFQSGGAAPSTLRVRRSTASRSVRRRPWSSRSTGPRRPERWERAARAGRVRVACSPTGRRPPRATVSTIQPARAGSRPHRRDQPSGGVAHPPIIPPPVR